MRKSKLDCWRSAHDQQEIKARKEFGENFRESRQTSGLTINKAAERMGISVELVMRIEAGEVAPEPYLLKRMDKLENRKVMRIS